MGARASSRGITTAKITFETAMLFKRKKRRDLIVGLDLGTNQIKAAVVQKQGNNLRLTRYAVRRLPGTTDRSAGNQMFVEQLQQLLNDLGVSERRACVTISSSTAMVCQTEFPRMPIEEVKSALKLNSARYLRRDFSSYFLDVAELVDPTAPVGDKKSGKMKVLVGGASKEEVEWYRNALLAAKIRPETIELSAVSVINAFQKSFPEICETESVLLVDIGGLSTSINFLRNGQPVFTRIMSYGGMQISDYIGQMLRISEAAAEEEKRKMTDAVQAHVRAAISPLAREVRSSIDFFERQQESHVGRAFACGGSACSPKLLEFLSEEVGVQIESWNPVQTLDTTHFNGDGQHLVALAPTLAAAVGAAVARL